MESNRKLRVTALNGSPRAENGFTNIVVNRFLAGAESAGAETGVLYPAKMKIAPCVGCLRCWFKTPGVCRHKDDMPKVIEAMASSDVLVFASPVYVDSMTGQMKTMFDRLVSYSQPFFEFEGSRSYHPKPSKRRIKVVAISVCGFPEREHFEPISITFRHICQNMRAEFLGELFFPASSLMASDPELVASQLDAVEKAGGEAVRNGAVSSETLEAANREYVEDPEKVCEQINEMFHNLRKSFGVE